MRSPVRSDFGRRGMFDSTATDSLDAAMTLQDETTIRTKIGAGIASPAECAAIGEVWHAETYPQRIAREAAADRASTDLVTMADNQTIIDASIWAAWL